tara:strand:- start:1637 stop:2005 length:369 start_codon:yes stop_codon:yes gene_type:complete
MASLALKVPLSLDSINGFTTLDDFKQVVKQNFKMLLLTNPGERIMVPDYGVGLNTYLFSHFDQSTFNRIDANIREQVAMYLPVVRIQEILFDSQEMDSNVLRVAIQYAIPTLNYEDLLEFTI